MDKHFSSEEMKLVKRLPKTLQDRALKCLKEQNLISEGTNNTNSTKVLDSSGHDDKIINGFLIRETNKKTAKKSKIRKSEFTSLSRVQPFSTNLLKSTKCQTVSTKRTFKIYNN